MNKYNCFTSIKTMNKYVYNAPYIFQSLKFYRCSYLTSFVFGKQLALWVSKHPRVESSGS